MLSNAYFLAKFRFDTAENEPAKNVQNFRKMHFRKMHFRNRKCMYSTLSARRRGGRTEDSARDITIAVFPIHRLGLHKLHLHQAPFQKIRATTRTQSADLTRLFPI